MRLRTWMARAAICTLLLFPFARSAAADEAAGTAEATGASAAQTYTTAFTESSLSGSTVSAQQFFQIPDYWQVGGLQLELDYKISQITQDSRSSVTLTMNGVPFYSFRPVATDEAKQHLSVPIPIGSLVKGVNTLTVEGALQTAINDANLVCVPAEPYGSWLQLFDTSGLRVSYTSLPLADRIGDFHQRFLGLDTMDLERNAIAVPDQSAAAELEAATYALSGLAKASSLKDKPIPLLAFGDDSLKTKQAVILVALYDHLPDAIRGQLGNADLSGKALIGLVNTATQPTLVVTSQDPAMLVKAGRLVANQTLMSQMSGSTKLVDETTEVATPPASISSEVRLTSGGDKLTGDMHREKTYFVSLPGNRSIADASKLSLHFSYSSNLDFDRSLMTVLVNNTPIGSKKLTAELADGDSINLTLPKNLDISGNFTVTAAFDLEMKSAGCIQDSDQMPWAFIAGDSMLKLHTKDRSDLLFNNYPSPFLRDGSYNQVAVVLPQERDRYTYASLSNLFNLLGQYAVTNTGSIQFFDDSAGVDQLKDRQIIAIGTYRNNRIIRDSNDKLYFRYDANGSGFQSNEKMSIESDYGKRIGTLQLIDSPYGAGHGLLAVTGASSEYYYLASRLVDSEGKLYQVYGDGAVTDKDGNVQAFRFKKETAQAQSTVLSDVLNRNDVLSFMVSIVLVLVLVLFSLILLVRKYRKKGRGKR